VKLRAIPLDGCQPELWQPDSGWRPYEGPLPRLAGVDVAMDTETRDGGLAREIGPGWVYDDGHLCGVSVASAAGSLYVPVRHPNTVCRPLDEVVDWIEGLLRDCTVHFFNMSYDMAWLRHSGVKVWPERAHDAYLMSVMLDENHYSYELDDCCGRAGVAHKDTRLLEDAARALGVEPRSGLWRMPARYVGPYAEQDAVSTLQLSRCLLAQIEEQHQTGAYRTEVALVRVLHDMRARGIRVSTSRAEEAQVRLVSVRDRALAEIHRLSGMRASMDDVRSPVSCGLLFDRVGVQCPRTPKTNLPSVQKAWLARVDHPMGHLVREARQYDDLAHKFIGNYILDHQHRGRIHANINQLRDSDGGTRTHRLSYSSPPLQQMPARSDENDVEATELVRLIRSIFEAEQGEWWYAPDYAGQEPRILVHLAAVTGMVGVDSMLQKYAANPRTDYHGESAAILGWTRKRAKDTNQGIAYGMGAEKLGRTLGVTLEEARGLLRTHQQRMPYITALTEHCSNLAQQRGWVRLLDGARCHFDHWQPRGTGHDSGIVPVHTQAAARARWPNKPLERAKTYRAANRGCQGGAARQMKRAMVACHREGLLPLVQMHDELGFSVTTRRECEIAHRCMVEAIPLRVPVVVDMEIGRTWGDAKHTLEEAGL
jgi:Mesyanzhinovviridae DNA polymerase